MAWLSRDNLISDLIEEHFQEKKSLSISAMLEAEKDVQQQANYCKNSSQLELAFHQTPKP